MTLRDYFAGKYLLGLCFLNNGNCPKYADLAETAYQMADAMLAEREK